MPPQELTFGNPKQRQYTSGSLHGRKVNPYDIGKRSNQLNYIYDDDKLNTLYDFRFAPSTPTSRLARLNTYADGTPIEGELGNLSLLDLQMSLAGMQHGGIPVAGQPEAKIAKPGDFIRDLFLSRAVIPISEVLGNLNIERKEVEPSDAKLISIILENLAEFEKTKKSITKPELLKVVDVAIMEESKASEPPTEMKTFNLSNTILNKFDWSEVESDTKRITDEQSSNNRNLLSEIANSFIFDFDNLTKYNPFEIVTFYDKLSKTFPDKVTNEDSKNYNAKIKQVKRVFYYIYDKLVKNEPLSKTSIKQLNKLTNIKKGNKSINPYLKFENFDKIVETRLQYINNLLYPDVKLIFDKYILNDKIDKKENDKFLSDLNRIYLDSKK